MFRGGEQQWWAQKQHELYQIIPAVSKVKFKPWLFYKFPQPLATFLPKQVAFS